MTIIGAVSPPGGDTTEPVTAHTQRFVRCQWTLDRDLAYARHYPAVSWAASFSRDDAAVGAWQHATATRAGRRNGRLAALLAEADRLSVLAELVGASAMPGRERIVLLAGRLVREAVLQQNALSAVDSVCPAAQAAALADMVLGVTDRCHELVAAGANAAVVEDQDFSPVLRARDDARDHRGRARRTRRDARSPGLAGQRARSGGRCINIKPQLHYTAVTEMRGPLVIMQGVAGVGWDEFATIRLPSGQQRHGLVLEVDRDLAVVQVLEGTSGMKPSATRILFSGSPLRIPVGPAVAGPGVQRSGRTRRRRSPRARAGCRARLRFPDQSRLP